MGFYGTLEEHGHPAILGLRLKIENRRIGLMEAIVIRSTARGSFSAVQDLKDKSILHEALTPSERRSRDFDKNCTRIENGVVTSNNPAGNPGKDKTTVWNEGMPYGMKPGWEK